MNNKLSDFLSFRRMITPLIIQILFWVGVIVSVIAGLIMIVSGASSDYGGGGYVKVNKSKRGQVLNLDIRLGKISKIKT